MYALYLYFLGLSFRNTSKALEPFEEEFMSQSGIGYSSLILGRFTLEKEGYLRFS
jgi:hypothetical protein